MLAGMFYCMPKQLDGCLMRVKPKLTEAFGDTYPRVRGGDMLEEIYGVIKNPEMVSISQTITRALTDALAEPCAL